MDEKKRPGGSMGGAVEDRGAGKEGSIEEGRAHDIDGLMDRVSRPVLNRHPWQFHSIARALIACSSVSSGPWGFCLS